MLTSAQAIRVRMLPELTKLDVQLAEQVAETLAGQLAVVDVDEVAHTRDVCPRQPVLLKATGPTLPAAWCRSCPDPTYDGLDADTLERVAKIAMWDGNPATHIHACARHLLDADVQQLPRQIRERLYQAIVDRSDPAEADHAAFVAALHAHCGSFALAHATAAVLDPLDVPYNLGKLTSAMTRALHPAGDPIVQIHDALPNMALDNGTPAPSGGWWELARRLHDAWQDAVRTRGPDRIVYVESFNHLNSDRQAEGRATVGLAVRAIDTDYPSDGTGRLLLAVPADYALHAARGGAEGPVRDCGPAEPEWLDSRGHLRADVRTVTMRMLPADAADGHTIHKTLAAAAATLDQPAATTRATPSSETCGNQDAARRGRRAPA